MRTFASALAFGALCASLAGHAALAQDAPPVPPNDPIAERIFPPELIMKYQKAIQLTETQKNALIAEVKRAQGRIVDVQWDMQRAMEPLVESLGKDKPDEQQVLAQLDKVLAAERDFKRVQLTLAVRLKGILTPEQERMLLEMRGGAPRAGDAPKPAPPR
jgi:Spy/CpxP family protein refolding chaperone